MLMLPGTGENREAFVSLDKADEYTKMFKVTGKKLNKWMSKCSSSVGGMAHQTGGGRRIV